MPFKVRVSAKLLDIVEREGIIQDEIAEALAAVDEAATETTKPIGLQSTVETITTTNSIWYRLRPAKAVKYRIVFSLQRKSGYLTVEGIFRRDDKTYLRIKTLYDNTPERGQPE